MSHCLKMLLACIWLITLNGCSGKDSQQWPVLTSPDVLIIKYHIEQNTLDMEEFCRRLYLKNPKYEPNIEKRSRKLTAIFHPPIDTESKKQQPDSPLPYNNLLSHQLLEAAFANKPPQSDRVYLLALGMKKSIIEGYDGHNKNQTMFSGMQLSPKKLQILHANVQQLNWRLKTYRDPYAKPRFQTNALGEDSTINMGYEVIMTRILTRIADDIYLRNGQTPNFIFNMSTMFLPLFL